MLKRTTFLISALLLLILANVLMMSYASPVLSATGEGFANYVMGFENHEKKKEGFANCKNGFENHEKKKEGFQNLSPAGAKDHYEPIGAFDGIRLQTGNNVSSWRYTAPNEKLQGNFPKFEVGPDSLFMFRDNQAKPECCGASFSSDMGCLCTTPEQRAYINNRGSNRAPGGNPDF
jgi:hypothetical protein